MIPASIIEYLQQHKVAFKRRPHLEAVSAQELAASLHTSGYSVAKAVVVDADGQNWIAVLPASESVSLPRLTDALNADKVRLLTEAEFAPIFRDCQTGAEPPFGRLYDLPVVVDSSLGRAKWIVVRAGSHQESLEMAYSDFVSLEKPKVASFGILRSWTEAQSERESRAG